ncbi:hypothetical protein LENED_009048 [Lentinula edodes]|uniref:Uncharacterized protein n=1 Tax=Lentinula edodes TaxID=5353 RepID=A0A1Q3EIR3_LENED|nr:hypothetical protein LENED_009048 [Lentinula edodes]
MPPVFRPRLTRREPRFPTIGAVLEESHRIRQSSEFIELRPSHVFTVRHHPYRDGRRSNELVDYEEDIEEIDGVLVYGIQSSFLIPDWIFDEAANNDVSFAQSTPEPGPRPESKTLRAENVPSQRGQVVKIVLDKASFSDPAVNLASLKYSTQLFLHRTSLLVTTAAQYTPFSKVPIRSLLNIEILNILDFASW